MRNPERIDEFCEWLRYVWHKYPDWRFGQLICNLYDIEGNAHFFYKEDETLKEILKVEARSFYDANRKFREE